VAQELIKRAYAAKCLYATAERSWQDVLVSARDVLDVRDLWVVHWALAGQTTGHEWCVCSSCAELALTSPPTAKSEPRRCRMTPDCKGVMQRIAPRPRLTQAVKKSLGMI
jgi:hypothetical protein